MTADQIHDALTLLPADLIAETDRRRSGTPKIIPWKRYAAMAACFALVFCGGLLISSRIGMGGSPLMQKEEAAMAAPEAAQAPAALEKAPVTPTEAAAGENGACALPTAPAQEESVTEDTRADTTAGSIALQLPTLTIEQQGSLCEAPIGSYNWEIDNGDGTYTAICVDAAHIPESLPLLETEDPQVQLHFSETPDSILVWCQQDGDEEAQMLTVEGGCLTLLPGTCIYQVTACWDGISGFDNIVHYSFRGEVSTEGT